MIEFIILDEWVGLETVLLIHAHSFITNTSLPLQGYHHHCLPTPSVLSSPLPSLPLGSTGITIEGLADYVDNEPNTDSSDDPFRDEEWIVMFVYSLMHV